jgi:hypothetical protein
MTEYVASPPTEDPTRLLREKDIAIRYLLRECAGLDGEVGVREETIV